MPLIGGRGRSVACIGCNAYRTGDNQIYHVERQVCIMLNLHGAVGNCNWPGFAMGWRRGVGPIRICMRAEM
jgi:hypothetical protein